MIQTKKLLLVFSGITSALLVVFNSIGTFRLCGGVEYNNCMDLLSDSMTIFLPIIPLLIFSLITYKMKDKIFQTWWEFSRVWIPLSMFAILIAPSYSNNFLLPIEKGGVALFSSGMFILISTILVIYQSFNLRKRKR